MNEQMTAFEADELLEKIGEHQKTINDAAFELDMFVSRYEEKICRARTLFMEKTAAARLEIANLEEQLRRYAADNLPENSKTINLPSGQLSFRKRRPKFYFDDLSEVSGTDERLIQLVKANAPEFVKTKVTETADWASLKKNLHFDESGVYLTETGQILEGIHAQEFPDEFTVTTA